MVQPRVLVFRAVVVFAVGCALWALSATLHGDTYPRQLAIDAQHYRFSITVTAGSREVRGEAVATFRLVAPTPAIELDLISRTRNGGMTVHAVQSRGETVTFAHRNDRLRLIVPPGARPGEDVSFVISYSGIPALGLQQFTNIHGERVWFSEGWPNRARHWLPTIDHPYDKASAEMLVTAPADLRVVSNGVLVEEVDLAGQLRRTHWKQSVPLPSWLYAVGIARFSTHHAGFAEGVPLQTWSYPQDAATARTLFEETSRRALQFFSDRIGPFPYEKLANVQASGFAGGMENATVIFYGEKGVAAGRGPVVHEIAHQWFGNSVTERDWDDVWLSEGFASYLALLYREHFEGRDAFVDGLRRTRDAVLAAGVKQPEIAVVHRNIDDMAHVLNRFVYDKGAWVLHMLRHEVGTEVFWRGLREHYRRYRDGNASTADFRQVMEGVSGRDLEWFFAQWLTRGGNPRLASRWRYDAQGKAVALTLTQQQSGAPYRLAVDVQVRTAAGGGRVERVLLTQSEQTFILATDAPPTVVTLDPDVWLLAELE